MYYIYSLVHQSHRLSPLPGSITENARRALYFNCLVLHSRSVSPLPDALSGRGDLSAQRYHINSLVLLSRRLSPFPDDVLLRTRGACVYPQYLINRIIVIIDIHLDRLIPVLFGYIHFIQIKPSNLIIHIYLYTKS